MKYTEAFALERLRHAGWLAMGRKPSASDQSFIIWRDTYSDVPCLYIYVKTMGGAGSLRWWHFWNGEE